MEEIPFRTAKKFRIIYSEGILFAEPGTSEFAMKEIVKKIGSIDEIMIVERDEFSHKLSDVYGSKNNEFVEQDIVVTQIEDHNYRQHKYDIVDESPMSLTVNVLNKILQIAISNHASDVHLEPLEQGHRVMQRIDGDLVEIEINDKVSMGAVIARLKIMAQLDTANTCMPQDGRFEIEVGDQPLDIRLATLPTQYGERAAIRILKNSTEIPTLTKLGLSSEDKEKVDQILKATAGLFVVAGPIGGGKTTTLFSLLKYELHNKGIIISIEDPIEYAMPEISQTQVDENNGLSFANGLRALVRHDANVFVIGELRDPESAQIAAQSSKAGRLSLTTIHSNDAHGVIPRLCDLEVTKNQLEQSLIGIIYQRLVKKLCQDCASEIEPSNEVKDKFLSQKLEVPPKILRPRGCANCNFTGYKGRVGVYCVVDRSEIGRLLNPNSTLDMRCDITNSFLRSFMSLVFNQIVDYDQLQFVEM